MQINQNIQNALDNVVVSIRQPMIDALGDCKALAQNAVDMEQAVCQQVQVGFDALYWALGGLGFFWYWKFVAVRMCVKRLDGDNRWVVMAMLLKAHYPDVSAISNIY